MQMPQAEAARQQKATHFFHSHFMRNIEFAHETIELPDNQQDRDMIARELLIKFQMSKNHPMVDLTNAYKKF